MRGSVWGFVVSVHAFPTPEPSINGIRVKFSPSIPRDKILLIDGDAYIFGRPSVRARRRRPHGRTNGPRRWKRETVTFSPMLDRIHEFTT